MSTDLRAALREAAADATFDGVDVLAALHTGTRRVRRRLLLTVGSAALAVVVVAAVAVAVTGGDRPDSHPLPAHVVDLDLDDAENVDLDVLASERTTWRTANEIDSEKLVALTTEGQVLHTRYTREGNRYELGLLDPVTGKTDWLPPPAGRARPQQPVAATADRLVFYDQTHFGREAVLVFDRRSRTWETGDLEVPGGLEVHAPPRLGMGADGRLYLGSTNEGEPGPMRWWSYAVPQGGEARPEPTLTGASLAWGDGVQARADSDGHVVVSTPGAEQVVATERPEGCDVPSDDDQAPWPVQVALAGSRPVVTYWCGGRPSARTVVYDVNGREVQVSDATVLAADPSHILLAPAIAVGGGADAAEHGAENPGGVYLLDLVELSIARIGPGLHDPEVGLAAGVVLWNHPGPLDDKDVYDVVWEVARLQ